MVRVRQLDREPAPDEGFEALVDRRKREGRKLLSNGQKHLVGGWMRVRCGEKAEHGSPLLGVALTVGLERGAEVVERGARCRADHHEDVGAG